MQKVTVSLGEGETKLRRPEIEEKARNDLRYIYQIIERCCLGTILCWHRVNRTVPSCAWQNPLTESRASSSTI